MKLRLIRIVSATIFFSGITLLFLDFTGVMHKWLGWMAKIQFLPSVLAVNTITIAALLLLTILFGRIYCSVICPLGIMQDIISWFRKRRSKKARYRFHYTSEKKWLRYGFLVTFIVTLALGAHAIALLIAPYSAYGRIASNLLAPLYRWGNNALAWIAERAGSYAFYSTEVWIRSLPTLIIAVITFLTIFILAWKGGRVYCNTICPVGTILGFFSRRSIFVPIIDTDKCRNCGLCEKQCKSSCIDSSAHTIDYSRCVVCLDCMDSCREGAISYASRYAKAPAKNKGIDTGRRTFMATAAMVTGTVAAKAGKRKMMPASDHIRERHTCPVPAGAASIKNFTDHCTACQLCISSCPNNVLRPSSSLATLMQPEMYFDKGYCRPECTICSEVCPAGAIKAVSSEEKSSIQIGHAVIDLDLCVINTDNVKCGNCARRCPAGAISLVRKDTSDNNSPMIPVVDEERCIGCGACEHLCPAKPAPAIHVKGHEVHRTI